MNIGFENKKNASKNNEIERNVFISTWCLFCVIHLIMSNADFNRDTFIVQLYIIRQLQIESTDDIAL